MKIAIYHHLPSGGALGHLCEVAKALKTAGHELGLFIPATAEQEFGDLKSLVDHTIVFQRNAWKPIFPFLNPMLYRTYLGQQLTEEKYYLKHILEFEPDGIYLAQCRLWTEPPLLRYLPKDLQKVLYCAEPKRSFYEKRFIDERKKWPFWKKLWRLPTIEWMKGEMLETIQHADLVLCNSVFSKENLSKVYKGLEAKFTPIGVDCDLFKPNIQSPKKHQILSVGALDPSKNHDMAIKVASLLPEDTNFKVVIVTDRSYGKTADHLKELAHDLEVQLEIREKISIDALIQTYQESFTTVYCPHLEPFGRVSIESQACGTPVLGKNEGGLKETILSGVSGQLLEDDPKEYAEEILKWLDHPEIYQSRIAGAIENAQNNWNSKVTIRNHVQTLETAFSK